MNDNFNDNDENKITPSDSDSNDTNDINDIDNSVTSDSDDTNNINDIDKNVTNTSDNISGLDEISTPDISASNDNSNEEKDEEDDIIIYNIDDTTNNGDNDNDNETITYDNDNDNDNNNNSNDDIIKDVSDVNDVNESNAQPNMQQNPFYFDPNANNQTPFNPYGYMPPYQPPFNPNMQGYIPPNMQGHMPPNMQGYMPPNMQGYIPPNMQGYMPPNMQGHMPPNMQGYMPPNTQGCISYNMQVILDNEENNLDVENNPEIYDEISFENNPTNKAFSYIPFILLVMSIVFFAYFYISNNDNGFNVNKNNLLSDGNSPSMEISYTPEAAPNNDPTGVLTNNEIYEKVAPTVVGIAVYTKGLGQVLQSEGSGVVMSEDGFIITNYHVIANDSSNPVVKIEIVMNDGETYQARVIGGDSKTDLAVLKIDAINLTFAEFGDSSKLKIGDRVAVIGNPSGLAFAGSFTQGCVSAVSRNIYMSDLNAEIEYIQTDAAINSGNSGGAFINEYGQVVGISAAKMKVEAGYEGMGFALPINNVKIIVDSLIEFGYVAGRPLVGIEYKAISATLAELNSIPIGLRVYTVQETVDAYNYIVPGDIITMFDGQEVYDSESISNILADKRAGEELVLTVYRVDETTGISEYLEFTIILSESVGEKLAETMN